MKNALCSIKNFTLRIGESINRHPFIFFIILSLTLNLMLEVCGRCSFIDMARHVFTSPMIFLYNTMIVAITLVPATLLRKRNFYYLIVSFIWTGLGITNFVIMQMRSTPLALIDFQIIRSTLGIIAVYVSGFQFVLIIIGVLAIVAGLVAMYFKSGKQKPLYRTTAIAFCTVAIMLSLSTFSLLRAHEITDDFSVPTKAYSDYGFAYCFTCGIFDNGIVMPEDYSEDTVRSLMRRIDSGEESEPSSKPNVILLQLESFFDVNKIKGLTCSENPVPVFQSLKETCDSGYLKVPMLGAGTSNVEFEILTGMSLSCFGPLEYPYKTVLTDVTCESIASNLAVHGYTPSAIHNHTGSFYERYKVYSMLGFDNFTPLECIPDVTVNPLNWAHDSVLIDPIFDALNTSEGVDFVFAVSVQPHGKFPSEEVEDANRIKVSYGEDMASSMEMQYYINQINEVDAFIGKLCAALSEYDEDVMLVMYGDHLPSFGFKDEDLENNNVYQTEYVIWRNYVHESEIRRIDLGANELTAHILKELGVNTGVITKLNQSREALGEETYAAGQKLMQYDMLYGKMYSTGGMPEYEQTDMKLGLCDITVTELEEEEDSFLLHGDRFTSCSEVYVNGWRRRTEYIDRGTLRFNGMEPGPGDTIEVRQMSYDRLVMGVSLPYEVK